MEALKAMKKFEVIGILFCLMQTNLWSNPQFTLPAGIPGVTVEMPPTGSRINCVRIPVPNTRCAIWFPQDGSQPSTADAGQWSCANDTNPEVTDWWVRVFGGNRAVTLSHAGVADTLPAPGMSGIGTHIIQINRADHHITSITYENCEILFWRTFRVVACDPVGRVLLYRLLIEIRRADTGDRWCCGDRIETNDDRNNLRSLSIMFSEDPFSFRYASHCINIDLNFTPAVSTLQFSSARHGVVVDQEECPLDVALFHEMLHWFHYLRHFDRVLSNKSPTGFKYALRCYYGDLSDLPLWGTTAPKEEDVATVLGSPNYEVPTLLAFMKSDAFSKLTDKNMLHIPASGSKIWVPISDRFFNGDDLSENAYRCSKHLHMRFGHNDLDTNSFDRNNLPLRYQFAWKVAVECYLAITQRPPDWWFLQPNGAIKL